MASRLLTKRVLYLPNFGAAVNHFRAFSWHNDGENSSHYKYVVRNDTDSTTVWPDNKLGPFSPQDKRFFLPGSVGTLPQLSPVVAKPPETVDPEVLFQLLPSERQGNIICQAQEDVEFLEESDPLHTSPTPDDLLECIAHDCPELIKKEFAELFPWRNIMNGPFTVITISQKTQEDMTKWTEKVEEEREQLLKTFVEGATEICQALKEAGYWADFIDPSSGQPYLGQHTNATFYETDERYRKFGFEIEDLGCCKVIRHHLWGTHSYVGCIFSNAPSSSPLLTSIMKP